MRVLPRVLRRKANCLYDSFHISSNIKIRKVRARPAQFAHEIMFS